MKYGVSIFPTDYAIRPNELGPMLEERGFESVWFPEHTHIPSSRITPYPGGTELPMEYSHTYDPFVACTAAAMVTKRLKVATGICLVIERDPITMAKEVASVDMLSDGRFLFGIGGGWNVEEMENHGTDFKTRWRLLRERIMAMKRIWIDDEAEYHGRYVNFEKVWSWPKPVQKPHPPILMGGDGATTFQRVIEFCDGWMPINRGRAESGSGLIEKIAALRAQSKAAGRDPDTISISIFGARPDGDTIGRLEEAGVERVILGLPPAPREAVEPILERYAALVR
ncbi:MAG TPA: LLM class F420-dependent oxidoreductase [Dehalococcoidia bacterium]